MGKRAKMAWAGLAFVAVLSSVGVYALLETGNTDQAAACTVDEPKRAALDAAATGEVAAFQAADRPGSLGDLSFFDASASPVEFSAFAGKTVLFNLWATWCVPCRAEMPALDVLQANLGGEAFQVVPVSVDLGSDEKPKAFYSEIGLQHLPFYHDPTISTLDTLKKAGIAFGLPATVLTDGQGCILGWLNGPAEWASEDALTLIKAALDE